MRKEIWGRRKLALALCALLFAESAAPMEALAVETEESAVTASENTDDGEANETTGDETLNNEESSQEGENVSESGETANESEPVAENETANEADNTTSEDNNDASNDSQTEVNDENTSGNSSESATAETSDDNSESNNDSNSDNGTDNNSEETVTDADTTGENTGNASDTDTTGENADSASDTDNADENVADGNGENPENAAITDGDAEDNAADVSVSDGNAEVPESAVFDFETVIDGYKIKLHADEGVVPAGTEVTVKKVEKVAGKHTDDLVNEVLPEDSVVYNSASFDITLSKDGVEFEPDGKVSVEITLDEELADVSNENEDVSVQVFHIEDNAETTEVDAEVDDNATDVYNNEEETVVSYDAESFSVYDVSAVLNFTTTEVTSEVNPVYENLVEFSDEELTALGAGVDSAQNVKALMSSGGNCTSIQEMGEACKRGIMARQAPITINFKLPGSYNETTILNSMIPIAFEHTGVPNEGDYVQWASIVRAYQSSISYVDGITYGSIVVKYVYTHNYDQEVATTNAINNLVKSLGLTSSISDYEKARRAYNWICSNVRYDYSFDDKKDYGDYSPWSCYSAVVSKNTVCEGYALLYYRLMLIAGVDCRLIAGDGGQVGNTAGHGWNIVKIGDYYYNVDSTWGAETPRGWWFLKGSKNFDYVTQTYNSKRLTFVHDRYADYKTSEFNYVYPTSYSDYSSSTSSNSAGIKVTLNTGSTRIGVGQQITLKATVSGSNNQTVMWNSSDSTIASVNTAGVVTGMKNGECEIFATSKAGGKKARCRILVTDGRVQTIDATEKNITIYAGSKAAINAYVFPEWASNKSIKFKSSNKKVASVNKNGIVTGKKKGKCTITCTSVDGGYKVKIKINVKKATRVKSIKLSKKKLKLTVGSVYTLGVSFNPKKATNKEVTWKSSKPGVVSVDANGNIVALSKGKAKITAKSVDGKHKATCTVKVK
ncbi:Ig-like domain-containing protein [Butyrivibrio sp. AC2005]|uniref:Ig-like domain-containing protein n=1 Tax=Butyrivibrio sp. AC2005 TaxID=1280672 RepID=UPI00041ABF8F|nr:Ig-like domain-containing protein [Butyrivibrio sp. AC2005]